MENESTPTGSNNPSGGCAMACALFFVLLFIVWPLLHLLGGTYEPDILLFPFLLGGPAFIVAHILAVIALLSKSSDAQRRGKKALWIIWGGIAFIVLAALIAFLGDKVRGKG